MADKNLTEIVVVMDRSGSMRECQKDAEGGLNTFVEEQKKLPGRARLTLVEFDDQYNVVHDGLDLKDTPPYTLVPRGWTALLDAVGKAITTVGERLSKTPEHERPGLVVVVIITDGHENKSTEYTKEQIKEMITHQTNTYKWQFTFLGANVDAFDVAAGIGVTRSAAAGYNVKTAGPMFIGASRKVGQMRAASALGQEAKLAYSDDERDEIAGKK